MEIDLPKDAISKSQWLLNNAKKAENIYEARSWLITARNAAPGRGCRMAENTIVLVAKLRSHFQN